MSDVGQEIINSVRRHAAVNPDYVYDNPSGCVYVKDGQPSCLIGCALWELGFIDADFEFNSANVGGVGAFLLCALGVPSLDPDEFNWLGCAQLSQDSGRPWGKAVAYADETVPLS